MDTGVWQATASKVTRVRLNLETKHFRHSNLKSGVVALKMKSYKGWWTRLRMGEGKKVSQL